MINMKRYAGGKTPYELFSDAVGRMRKGNANTIALNKNKHKVEIAYYCYERVMNSRKLNLLKPSKVLSVIKQPLLNMYSPECQLVKEFREWHFQNNPQPYNNLCPYCAIGEANTTEHILPKSLFPEYAVNVYNLIPTCSVCNNYKGDKIVDENSKVFTINFYTDTLPNKRYLFANITPIVGGVQLKYYLNDKYVIDKNLYALIERHFNRYHLIERFHKKAEQELSNIENYFKYENITSEADYDKAAEKLIKKTEGDANSYGKNHWKIVMYLDAATSPIFKSYIMKKLNLIP